MRFTKMHGCGNDYVYVSCFDEEVEDPGALARLLSDRHFGIGSDGLILIRPSKAADFWMDMYNADGSPGGMCGNGIRCVGKYAYDNGLTGKTRLTIESGGEVRSLELRVEAGKAVAATVDMGEPVMRPARIPVLSDRDEVVEEPFRVGDGVCKVTCVSMGNPHAVIFVDDVGGAKIEEVGPLLENHARFPERTNVEFVRVADQEHIDMRVWERGSGETLACGTGACASAYACMRCGKVGDEVKVRLLGGDLSVRLDRESGHIFLTGPAVTVFTGEVDVSSLAGAKRAAWRG